MRIGGEADRGTKLWLPKGRTALCPVAALETWLVAAISDGPLFRRLWRLPPPRVAKGARTQAASRALPARQRADRHRFDRTDRQAPDRAHRARQRRLCRSQPAPIVQSWLSLATLGHRPSFIDFPGLLSRFINFDEIAAWGPRTERPVLIVGAANVSTGKLAKFVSSKEAIRLEHVLASCAVPNIFPAVRIDDHAYWDGLFSDNPPVEELIRPRSVGPDNVPDEIWLIKINPTACDSVPDRANTILDRRNQMEGNISLFHQLDHLEMLNDIILAHGFRPEFLAQFDIQAPIRIPKSFSTETNKPCHIPCIEMPLEVQATLDYEGKIDRSPRNIDWLIAQGESAAETFLRERAAVVATT